MSRKVLSVIGGLSDDTIHITIHDLQAGGMVEAAQYSELGGRALNIAIAAARSFRPKPDTEDALLPDDGRSDDPNLPEVRLIGAVVDEKRKAEYSDLLRKNGVNTDGVRVLKAGNTQQDKMTSIFNTKVGRSQRLNTTGVSQIWSVADFDSVESLGGGKRPDLVVVTNELQREVVEQIITVAHDSGIQVLLYASPHRSLLTSHYEKITHLVCSESDAGAMLGYDSDEVTIDTLPEICEEFYNTKRIEIAIVKMGYMGSFTRNADVEIFSPGYLEKREVADSSGSTPAFVGVYAAEIMRTPQTENFDISAANQRANKACAICSSKIGYKEALPWADEIDEFDRPHQYADFNDLRRQMTRTPVALEWGE